MRPKPKLEVGCWCRLGFLGDLARTWVSLSRLSRPRRGRAARAPPRAPSPPPPALAGCAAVFLSGCAGRRPPSVRENMRFLATKPSSGTPNAPLRPKRALLPGESPGRQNRQGRCAVETGPIRARTRIAGQKSRAREHGEGNVRRAEAVNPWPETAGTRT